MFDNQNRNVEAKSAWVKNPPKIIHRIKVHIPVQYTAKKFGHTLVKSKICERPKKSVTST